MSITGSPCTVDHLVSPRRLNAAGTELPEGPESDEQQHAEDPSTDEREPAVLAITLDPQDAVTLELTLLPENVGDPFERVLLDIDVRREPPLSADVRYPRVSVDLELYPHVIASGCLDSTSSPPD